MRKNVIIHLFFLFLSLVFSFFWVIDENLSFYSLQLTAVFLLALIITRRFLSQRHFKLLESIVSTVIVILVVTSSGGLTSPLFFLNLLLLFELSLLLEPVIPIFLSLALIIFYLSTAETEQSPLSFLELASLPLMTPLAFFLGKIYQKSQNQKKEIKNLSHKLERLKEELIEEEIKTPYEKS